MQKNIRESFSQFLHLLHRSIRLHNRILTEARDCKHSQKYLSDNLRVHLSINSFFHRRFKKSLSHIAHYKELTLSMNKNCIIIPPTANKTKFNMVELNQLLLEFEAHLNGDAVTEEWKKPRDSWMSQVSAAIDEKQLRS